MNRHTTLYYSADSVRLLRPTIVASLLSLTAISRIFSREGFEGNERPNSGPLRFPPGSCRLRARRATFDVLVARRARNLLRGKSETERE